MLRQSQNLFIEDTTVNLLFAFIQQTEQSIAGEIANIDNTGKETHIQEWTKIFDNEVIQNLETKLHVIQDL